ncbi:MAG: STAS domain-containing protein [Fibrobacterota bacterium]
MELNKKTLPEGITLISLGGSLNKLDISELRRFFDKITSGEAGARIALDFSEVEFINSNVIGYLITLHKKISVSGGKLSFFNLNSHVLEVFNVLEIGRVFHIADTEEESVNYLKNPG